MAFIAIKCDVCASSVQAHIGQSITFNLAYRLVWSMGYRCSYCGNAIELDDDGLPPQRYRQAIFDQEGCWGLYIGPDMPIPLVLKGLRIACEVSLKEVSALRSRLPGTILTGTQVEMQRFRQILASQAIHSEVIQLAAGSTPK